VLRDPGDLSILGVVELDDATHSRSDRQARGEFLNADLKAAEVPLFRFEAKRTYSVDEVRNVIYQSQPDANATDTGGNSMCPTCGAELRLRKSRKGRHAGVEFWGCTDYPRCKTVVPVEAASEARVAT